MKLARFLLLPAALVSLVLFGCQSGSSPDKDGKITVAVTMLPHAWLVQQVGGDRVEVVTLVKPGESAELYQPTDAQISQVMRSKAYFRVGMPLERSRGFQAIESSGKVKVVDLRDGIPLRQMERHAHHEEGETGQGHKDSEAVSLNSGSAAESHEGKDPHIWLSPRLLKIQARTVADTLAEIDPAHKEDYEQNLASLSKRLDEIDQSIRTTLEPYRGKAFFVFHPAWGYFADEYGLRQIAIETEGKEPSDQELTALQQQVREQGVKVIFIHPQTASRAAKAIATAIGGRTETLEDLPADLPESLLRTARLLAQSYRGETR